MVVDEGLNGKEIFRGISTTHAHIEDGSPNPVFIVVALEEIDGADHEIALQSVVTHRSPVDFEVANGFHGLRIVTIKELNMV